MLCQISHPNDEQSIEECSEQKLEISLSHSARAQYVTAERRVESEQGV